MALVARLPLLPPGAQKVSDSLAIQDDGERIVLFNAAGPIFSSRIGDRAGLRLAAVTAVQQDLAGVTAMARALGLHRTTLFRDGRKYEEEGIQGLFDKPRGPKGAHKLTPSVVKRAQEMLDRGESIRSTAAGVGVSSTGLRHAIGRGLLTARSSKPCAMPADSPLASGGPLAQHSSDTRATPGETKCASPPAGHLLG